MINEMTNETNEQHINNTFIPILELTALKGFRQLVAENPDLDLFTNNN
jgi:hypothetical protein